MKRFTTFEGVFVPCLLSILGVIMYLRLGWVVGHAGLIGTIVIITLANLITLTTALSLSSMVTNIRIGPGGVYSVIVKSLGLEMGGALGIPLYICQAVSVAFYIVGFTECWLSVFGNHSGLLVSLIVWAGLLMVSYMSTKMAFRIQYVILGIIFLSIVSIMVGKGQGLGDSSPLTYWSMENFWGIFAIFFPAVTGILTGANMSGELKNPKYSIPVGTLGAIGVSFFIYILLAAWLFYHAPAGELIANKTILIDLGRWRWAVVGGIMGATLSSALAMFVGSPRVLLALSKHTIVPFSSQLGRVNKKGEPQGAILFTALVVLITLFYGTLDGLATLLTMFFLITYGMINASVFIEQLIGIASFRPTFKVPRFVPFLGALGCLVVMLLINLKFTLITTAIIIGTFLILLRREIEVHSPDVRSGLLVFMAEQFAKAAGRLPYHPKIWKPNLLMVVDDFQEFEKAMPLMRTIVTPAGRLKIFSVIENKDLWEESANNRKEDLNNKLSDYVLPLRNDGVFVETSVVESDNFLTGSVAAMQILKGMFFPPNALFYVLRDDPKGDEVIKDFVRKASLEGLGLIILHRHAKAGFGNEKMINLWIRRKSPNVDLSILIALQLKMNWDGQVGLIHVIEQGEDPKEARTYLERLSQLMRIPSDVEINILEGDFRTVLKAAPPADINIFGMSGEFNLSLIRDITNSIGTSVLFLRDSEHESAVA